MPSCASGSASQIQSCIFRWGQLAVTYVSRTVENGQEVVAGLSLRLPRSLDLPTGVGLPRIFCLSEVLHTSCVHYTSQWQINTFSIENPMQVLCLKPPLTLLRRRDLLPRPDSTFQLTKAENSIFRPFECTSGSFSRHVSAPLEGIE